MVQYPQGNDNKVLTFKPYHISFNCETALSKPGELKLNDDVQSQFQIYFLITLLVLCLLSFSTRAQINSDRNLDNVEISFVVTKLQNKVLLNESQVTFVKQVLQQYSVDLQKIHNPVQHSSNSRTKQKLVNDTNRQIESVLDDRQKMKYDIIENDWWACVKDEQED